MKETAAVWEDINVLVPWDENPRHNQSAIKKVADSIKRFGFASPIIARKSNKMVIAGHTRLEASKLLKLKTVPVRYLDIDPADAKMLALADNKIGEIADWDEEKLNQIIKDLNLDNDELEDLGWNNQEIEQLLLGANDEDYIAPDNKELSMDDFDNFDHQCPRCNFEWNE
jgi:ParB-like chromosome segregation protein Spo0J